MYRLYIYTFALFNSFVNLWGINRELRRDKNLGFHIKLTFLHIPLKAPLPLQLNAVFYRYERNLFTAVDTCIHYRNTSLPVYREVIIYAIYFIYSRLPS